ncbi:MAG: hypothetical protein M3Q09_05880 [Gemmatimonadota bacterium]|nr:hypothetical protein [Gemmatimonadota bacterium]
MKRFMLALAVLSACTPAVTPAPAPGPATSPGTTGGNQLTGAASARSAVEQFLVAVRAEDLQAMGTIFGTARGPSRDNMDGGELEKRLIILQCFFNHDKSRIVGETLGDGGHRIVTAELIRGTQTRSPKFYVIPGPGRRWYLDNMEIVAVRDFCRKGNT